MKLVLPLIIILLSTFMITCATPILAQGHFGASINTIKANQQSRQQVRVKNTAQAAQLAQRRYGGKVLKVQAQKSGYRVKLIQKNGHIISVFVNAKSGKVSGQ